MRKGFTGRHMAASMVGFFGVVIGVNVLMAMEATRTFGGTVVENSYVASQHFNRWLDEAQAEKLLGWTVDMERGGNHALLSIQARGSRVGDAAVTGVAEHPLGRLPDLELRFRNLGSGRYRSIEALPPGRWRVRLDVRRAGQRARFIDEVPA